MASVVVPSVLAAQAEGRNRFDVEAETLGEALLALPERVFPRHVGGN